MNHFVDVMPDRVLCFPDEGPQDSFYIPIPDGYRSDFYVRRKKKLRLLLRKEPQVALIHPDSKIIAVGIVDIRKGIKIEGQYLVMDIAMFSRAIALSFHTDSNGNRFVEIAHFIEEKPTREEFNAKEFQEKIQKLRILWARAHIAMEHGKEVKEEDIEVKANPRHKPTEETLGLQIDAFAGQLNPFVEEALIKDRLIGILEESSVSRRLDKTIQLYEFFLEHFDEWEDQINELLDSHKNITRDIPLPDLLRGLFSEDEEYGEEVGDEDDDSVETLEGDLSDLLRDLLGDGSTETEKEGKE